MRLLAFLLLSILPSFFVGRVEAQDALPDVVETRDGGMVRGLIVERVPGQYVVIRTASGELRRIEEANVHFAGPASSAVPAPDATPAPAPGPSDAPVEGDVPPAPPPPPVAAFRAPAPAGTATLRVESDPPRLTLMLQTAEAYASAGYYSAHAVAYDALCTAPCETHLRPGMHVLAVREPDGTIRAVPGTVDIPGDANVRLGLQSRRGQRVAMALTWLAVAGIGAAILPAGLRKDDGSDYYGSSNGVALIGAGSGMLILGVSLAPLAVCIRDRGRVEVRPATF